MRRVLPLAAVLAVALACSSGDDAESGDAEAFCARLVDFQADGGGFTDLQPTDPADVEAVLDELRELRELAPDEVEAEVEVLTTAFEEFSTALASGDGDLGQILEQVGDFQDAQELSTAAERLADYAAGECDLGAPEGS